MACALMSYGASKAKIAPSYAWGVTQPLGLHVPATIDTLEYNYQRQFVPSEQSDAWACTGNLGGEGINMIYAERQPISDFFLRDALRAWYPNPDSLRFYNTRIPMTLLSYNTGGGRENTQDRLSGIFSGNINRRAQVGALLDYLYSKGCYNYQSTKDLTWGFSGSYMGDRWEMQASYYHYNLLNKENGGITNDLYITDPAEVQGGVSSINPKTIPTNLSNAHTRVKGGRLWLNNRYKVGHWHTEMVDDTTEVKTYIPVTSFVWTMSYDDNKHLFVDKAAGETRGFFEHTYLYNKGTYDNASYWNIENTFGVQLLEGFHRYAKFGLAAFITHRFEKYKQVPDSLDHSDITLNLDPLPDFYDKIRGTKARNLAWVGGQLTRYHARVLTFAATARIGLLGDVAGDLDIGGNITARIPIKTDSMTVTGYGRFTNQAAPYLINNYRSNHFIWHNEFGKQRNLCLGGRLEIPWTHTSIDVSIDNINNYIYFGPECLPMQYDGGISVFSARLNQHLRVGILNWQNNVTYQTSTQQSVLPLPKFALYSNLYLKFRIATLKVQLGVDCNYYTSYYGMAYQPALATFHTQDKVKVGNYPFMNVYANMKLSKVRFYVMMSHVNKGIFGGNNYFSSPHYPLNPRRFQLGISVDFLN